MTTTETMTALVREVETEVRTTQIPAAAIMGKSRRVPIVQARWAVWRRLSEVHGMSANAIALAWGCNHATILHALRGGKAGMPPVKPQASQGRV